MIWDSDFRMMVEIEISRETANRIVKQLQALRLITIAGVVYKPDYKPTALEDIQSLLGELRGKLEEKGKEQQQ